MRRAVSRKYTARHFDRVQIAMHRCSSGISSFQPFRLGHAEIMALACANPLCSKNSIDGLSKEDKSVHRFYSAFRKRGQSFLE